LRLVATLAEDRTIAAGLERNRGLLAASSADNCGSLRGAGAIAAATTPAVSATTAALLFILLCLTARFASLRRRIAALAEKRLIVGRKCKVLSTVAACKLQVPSHIGSLVLFVPSGEFLRLFDFSISIRREEDRQKV
jgi:hypothetical protein